MGTKVGDAIGTLVSDEDGWERIRGLSGSFPVNVPLIIGIKTTD